MKAYLEKRISDLDGEIGRLRGFLEVVDALLAERSFKTVEIPPGGGPATQIVGVPGEKLREVSAIATLAGESLADVQVTESELRVVPQTSFRWDSNSPPLRAFLVNRVLEPMRVKDQEFVRAGQISDDRAFSYELIEESGQFRGLKVKNYGDDRRLLELKNAIRWTLRRMYEKAQPKS
jgi:hypothetical protein